MRMLERAYLWLRVSPGLGLAPLDTKAPRLYAFLSGQLDVSDVPELA